MSSSNRYYILNKDNIIAEFECNKETYDEYSFHIKSMDGKLPIGFEDVENWLSGRRAPKHRAYVENLFKSIGCYNLDDYIRFTHALTLTDTFWIKPVNSSLNWDDVSLFRNSFDETIAHIAFEGGLYSERFATLSPEFSTDGTYAKCWIRETDDIYLLKRGSTGARNAGLEPFSEMYVSQIAKAFQLHSLEYDVVKYRGQLASKCRIFTSEREGFAPAYRILGKNPQIKDMVDFYESIGSGNDFRKMIVFDALILNTDRHLGNHGILFDTETLEPIRMAPVFDNNQGLLPYAEMDDLKINRMEYLAELPTRIGTDFNAIAHEMLTPSIRNDLRNMCGFKFSRDTNYSLPEERLNVLEEIVDIQIGNILQDIRLYIHIEADQAIESDPYSDQLEGWPDDDLDNER